MRPVGTELFHADGEKERWRDEERESDRRDEASIRFSQLRQRTWKLNV